LPYLSLFPELPLPCLLFETKKTKKISRERSITCFPGGMHTQSISFWTWFNAGLTRGWTVAIDRNRVRGSSPMPQRNQERPSIGWRLYWHPKGSRKDSTVQFASEAPDTRQYHLTISSRMQFVFVFVRSLDLTRAEKDSTTADAACFSSILTLMCTVCLSGG
jgi:hypothetical protein